MLAGRGGKRFGRRSRDRSSFLHSPSKSASDSIPPYLREKVTPTIEAFLKNKFFGDRCKDGLIGVDSVTQILRETGLNPIESDANDLIAEFDEDGDGVLNFTEFVEMWGKIATEEEDVAQSLDMFARAFEFFDRNNNASIETDEFRTVMMEIGDKLTDVEVQEFFALMDTNKDGVISWVEFIGFLKEDKEYCEKALKEGGKFDQTKYRSQESTDSSNPSSSIRAAPLPAVKDAPPEPPAPAPAPAPEPAPKEIAQTENQAATGPASPPPSAALVETEERKEKEPCVNS
ncbi:hypothetical protein CYMTET_26230 [Cymbomonas tetramitiformis]|uniref:EF-hand domain-containing protein n=1 Tax=Cymbomonas tetramitiformis TaxID=36881 RepID=A0AAE0KY38_9CHLO|nr:hypothetical protein CYMTET_26230 [Cymbomonas tetramitiformis]